MLLLISVHNELSRLPFFCILSKQIRRFLLGAEHHNKRWLLICSRPSLLLSADRVPRQTVAGKHGLCLPALSYLKAPLFAQPSVRCLELGFCLSVGTGSDS